MWGFNEGLKETEVYQVLVCKTSLDPCSLILILQSHQRLREWWGMLCESPFEDFSFCIFAFLYQLSCWSTSKVSIIVDVTELSKGPP